MKDDAIIALHVGEFNWEKKYFVPYVLNKRKKYKNNVKLIVCTRTKERQSLYEDVVDIFHLFDEDEPYMNQKGFKLIGFRNQDYYDYLNEIVQLYSKKFNIIEKIYPRIENKRYLEKNQFKINEL